jgi:cytochrome c oxidase assembly protein subunit 11
VNLRRRNRNTALAGLAVILAMAGLTAAAVPLYDLFCRVTGFGGTTQVAEAAPEVGDGRPISVAFNADVNPDLPWTFRPLQRRMTVPVGEQHLAFYEAVNHADAPVVGMAVYNVSPHKAGLYFNKIACFCFEEQTLGPGERVEMPVSFFVDPDIDDFADTAGLAEITLSYTFFIDRAKTEALRQRLAADGTAETAGGG